VTERFRTEAAHFEQRPGLVRGLALSQLGREVRGHRRRKRVEAIRQALRDDLGGLPEDELRRAGAVLAYLHNMLAYTPRCAKRAAYRARRLARRSHGPSERWSPTCVDGTTSYRRTT